MREKSDLVAFLSYAHADDDDRNVTKFWEGLRSAMPQGKSAEIFQDRIHLRWGVDWRKSIRESLNRTTFLIPILTPNFFQSHECRDELKCFLEREYALRRQDLILPVYFRDCPEVNDQITRTCDYLAAELAKHHYADWRKMNQKRYFTKEKVELKRLASMLWDAYLQPAPNLNELVVDQAAGDYRSIQAAIRSATDGTRIAVKEGVYREALSVDKPIEIVGIGAREKIVIESDDNNVISFQTAKGQIARIANLSISCLRRKEGSKRKNCSGVKITQGNLRLQDCDVTSQHVSCISIQGDALPWIKGNHIHDGDQEGIWIADRACGLIEGNDICHNGLAGIAIRNARPTVRENRIYEGRDQGIYIGEAAGGMIENNIIRENRGIGIEIDGQANPTVRENHVHSNGKQGIHNKADGRATIINDNEVSGHPAGDVVDEGFPGHR
jgi:parallel beta-helix repeat protein